MTNLDAPQWPKEGDFAFDPIRGDRDFRQYEWSCWAASQPVQWIRRQWPARFLKLRGRFGTWGPLTTTPAPLSRTKINVSLFSAGWAYHLREAMVNKALNEFRNNEWRSEQREEQRSEWSDELSEAEQRAIDMKNEYSFYLVYFAYIFLLSLFAGLVNIHYY